MAMLEVSLAVLRGLALLAADKDDMRYPLRGVRVEPTDGGVLLVATDGHVLGALRLAGATIDAAYTIPTSLIARVRPAVRRDAVVSVDVDLCVLSCTLWVAGAAWSLAPDPLVGVAEGHIVTAQYPNWRKALPAKVSLKPRAYDPGLVARLAKCSKLLSPERTFVRCSIYPNGDNAAWVDLGVKDAAFWILPLAGDFAAHKPTLPVWLKA